MLILKVTTIGSSAGVILSKEALAHLNVQKGDNLFLTEAPGGGYSLTPYDPAVAKQVELGEQFMRDYRDTFKALAK